MKRQLSNKKILIPNTTQPVNFGGTGGITGQAAKDSLHLLSPSQVGAAYGAVPLDANAKVPPEFISGLTIDNGDTIQVNETQIYTGQTIDNILFITNYDCERFYDISTNTIGEGEATVTFFSRDYIEQSELAAPGSMSGFVPGMISLAAPDIPGILELTINNKMIPITVVQGYIDTPTIEDLGDKDISEGSPEWFIDIGGQIFGFQSALCIGASEATFTQGYYQNPVTLVAEFSFYPDCSDVICTLQSAANVPWIEINGTTTFYDAIISIIGENTGGAFPTYARVKYVGETLESLWSVPVSMELFFVNN